jgi:hypothetical protein
MGYKKAADGVAKKGKTKGTAVAMAGKTGMKAGGMAKMMNGGMAKTKMAYGGMAKMKKGGMCK